ncbi:MAG: hypothetical protein B6D44_16880 [Ignavibacteriales bacterium UTCHB2]|nr:MAG: hypothetical protein B6D44_16880 [Ignavibacteriales bacterium UTCHB2]
MRIYYSDIKLVKIVPAFYQANFCKKYFLTRSELVYPLINIYMSIKYEAYYEGYSSTYLSVIIVLQILTEILITVKQRIFIEIIN